MKALLLVILLMSYRCSHGPVQDQPGPQTKADQAQADQAQTEEPAILDFSKDIQPIFESHCTPCHFKGGKMYERMPFDQAGTIIDFQEGILRRLKNEEEARKIRDFIQQQK